MANENENPVPPVGENHDESVHHESWIKHIVNEIKEEIAELTEEAQQMDPDDFSVLGNGHINHVHDHHHDDDKKPE